MFKDIAITLCREFVTQQNISAPLSAQTYLCNICAFLTNSATGSLFCFVCVRGSVWWWCVCMCFHYIFDALQATPLSEIHNRTFATK